MPDFDGTGPLKQGRIIRRGLSPCRKCSDRCECRIKPAGLPVKEEYKPE